MVVRESGGRRHRRHQPIEPLEEFNEREDRVKDQTAATPAVPGNARRASTRLVQREPSDRVVAIGLRDRWLGDLYHHLLTLPWWGFLLGLAAVYLGLNILFAVLYLLGDAAIANARPGAFSDAFFFSVETISTIGYGQMSPATLYGNLVMTVEAMFGLILLASSAGLVLARFSRPTARVIFSKVAVVAPYNGVPTLSFRLANERRNQILEAQVAVTLAREERTAARRIDRVHHRERHGKNRAALACELQIVETAHPLAFGRHYPIPLQLGTGDNPFLEPRACHGVDPGLSTRARPVTQSLNAVLFVAVMPFVSR